MEEHTIQTINAFDSCFTTGSIQMLKILFSHLPGEQQGGFAVYIKMMELLHTFSLMRNPALSKYPSKDKVLSADFFSGNNEDSISLLQELMHFSSPPEAQRIKSMIQMMENMKKMQEMLEMIAMLQEMFPMEGNDTDGSNFGNPFEILNGMMAGTDGNGINMSDILGLFGNTPSP